MERPNKLTELLGIKYPIIQAPMAGGVTSADLVACVSNAGALGSLGAAYMQPRDLCLAIKEIQAKTKAPFLVNLFVPQAGEASLAQQAKMCNILNDVCKSMSLNVVPVEPPYSPDFDKQFSVLLAMKVPIFSCIFGVPEKKYIVALKRHNIKLIGTATSLEEALQLKDAGFDAIVAQGIEAGGHRGTFSSSASDAQLSTMTLVATLHKKVDLPIIAAGGIANGESIHAAMEAGAMACQLGTAFLTTDESGAHVAYKKMLLQASAENTVLTRAFSGRLARAVSNHFTDIMQSVEMDILPFPVQNKLTKQVRLAAAKLSNPDFMSLWAGQRARLCQSISASCLIEKLVREWSEFTGAE